MRRPLLFLAAAVFAAGLLLGFAGCATTASPRLAVTPVQPAVVVAPSPPVPAVIAPAVVVPPPPITPAQIEPPTVAAVPLPPSAKRAWSPRTYAAYYGTWQDSQVQRAQDFELVIFHPGDEFENLTQTQVQAVRRPDANGVAKTRMCAYITIGEEDGPLAPPNVGDDCHGPVHWENNKLVYTEKGYPARYVDDKGKNGKPDENGEWHSRFIYIGDPVWQRLVIERMQRIEQSFGPIDGFFLDTVDTVAEPSYSYMQGPMLEFLTKLRATFPQAYLISNRGMALIQYDASRFRNAINAMMYENLVSEWDAKRKAGIFSPDLADNVAFLKKVVAPQVRRADGFDLLVLDYADPAQAEYPYLMHLQREVLGDLPHSRYLSTIDLDAFFPVPANYGDAPTQPLPRILATKLTRAAGRRVQVELAVDRLGDWQLNDDLLVEVVLVKAGADVLTGTRVVPAEPATLDATTGRVHVTVAVPRDSKATQAMVRFITAKAARQSLWSRQALPQ